MLAHHPLRSPTFAAAALAAAVLAPSTLAAAAAVYLAGAGAVDDVPDGVNTVNMLQVGAGNDNWNAQMKADNDQESDEFNKICCIIIVIIVVVLVIKVVFYPYYVFYPRHRT